MNFNKELKKYQNDCYNRLHSIFLDAAFVEGVADAYKQYPIVANQRCGVWYINPNMPSYRPDIYAYFKSTDGHTNAWSFSLRRPNLHLVNHIMQNNGLLIVDSTRRGKRYPDALSKTIPIWCAVVSSALLNTTPEALFYTPPHAITDSEKQAIRDQLGIWKQWLCDSALDLHHKLDKPLRPIFINPDTRYYPDFSDTASLDFYPVVCISASRYVPDEIERHTWGEYVQGSGDDHELWSRGLSAEVFWSHHEELLQCSSDMLDICVDELVSESASLSTKDIGGINEAFIGGVVYPCADETHLATDAAYIALQPDAPIKKKNTMYVKVPKSSKQAQKEFLNQLPNIITFIKQRIDKGDCVAVSDPNGGTDLASVVCVAAATLFFDDNGVRVDRNTNISKAMINMRLQWLLNAYPLSNPSRVSLKRLNDYLM